jgi:hypothetical protein
MRIKIERTSDLEQLLSRELYGRRQLFEPACYKSMIVFTYI